MPVCLYHDEYAEIRLIHAAAAFSVTGKGDAGAALGHVFDRINAPFTLIALFAVHSMVGRADLRDPLVGIRIHVSAVRESERFRRLEGHRFSRGMPAGNAATFPGVQPLPSPVSQHFMIPGQAPPSGAVGSVELQQPVDAPVCAH